MDARAGLTKLPGWVKGLFANPVAEVIVTGCQLLSAVLSAVAWSTRFG